MIDEEYKRLWQDYRKTRDNSDNYFKQFLYVYPTTLPNGKIVERPPTKIITPKEFEILIKLWDKEEEARKKLSEYLKKEVY